MNVLDMQEQAEIASEFLKLLANPYRLLVLCHLLEGEKTVGALEEELGLSQSALSQHLAKLRAHKILCAQRQGQLVYYRIADQNVVRVLEVLHKCFCQ